METSTIYEYSKEEKDADFLDCVCIQRLHMRVDFELTHRSNGML